jgi:hypothetical protein
MRLQINKKAILDALKNVEIKGKWANVLGLSSKSLGNYVHFQLHDNHLLLINSDESTTAIKAIPVESEDAGTFVLEISTIRKYLSKMGDEISIVVDDTVVMRSTGKQATLPIVVNHPFDGRINRFLEYWPITFDSDLEGLPTIGNVNLSCGLQISGKDFYEAIDACEIVNHGIYQMNFLEADEITRPKFIISSDRQISSYKEEVAFSNCYGESSTVLFSGPLHKFFDKDDTINIFIGDDQPIIMITETSALIRAPRMGL